MLGIHSYSDYVSANLLLLVKTEYLRLLVTTVSNRDVKLFILSDCLI